MAPAGAMAAVTIVAVVMVVRRLVLVHMRLRLLLGISRHTVGRLGAVEVRAGASMVGQACMEVKLAIHVMVVVWWKGADVFVAQFQGCPVSPGIAGVLSPLIPYM